jgi:calcium-dependent protein kinase
MSQEILGTQCVMEAWVQLHVTCETQLGEGFFAEVYFGTQAGKKCAVKIGDKNKFEQFKTLRMSRLTLASEVEALSHLQHIRILKLIQWFHTPTSMYMLTEWMRGGDLHSAITADIDFEEHGKRRLFKEICVGVKYMHEQRFMHRDLKPENILLTSTHPKIAHIKIADLGLAIKSNISSVCHTLCGTLLYIAPEVLAINSKDNPNTVGYACEADMWSLGVVLYVFLSGEPPFDENRCLRKQIMEGSFAFDGIIWTELSITSQDLVSRLIAVDANQRLSAAQANAHPWLCETNHVCRSFDCLSKTVLADLLLLTDDSTTLSNLRALNSAVHVAFFEYA